MNQIRTTLLGAGTVALLALTACTAPGSSNNTGDTKPAASDPDAQVVVWTDATRQPAFEAFAEANPDIGLKIELVQPDYISKLQLFNQTKKGWPDVIFVGNTNDIAKLASAPLNWAQPLDDLVEPSLIKDFGASNAPCEIDGALYCLRNDVAPTVLWYDSVLMDEYGYEVPTTWEEYGELGARVAKEHPGMALGAVGDQFSYFSFFQAVGCPIQDVTGPDTVNIDLASPECTTIAEILDGMIENGSLLTSGVFDPETKAAAKEGRILMMPGANWYGQFLFEPEGSFAFPAGRLKAAAPPALDGADAYSGSAGGGLFALSRHAKNFDGALAAATFAATDLDVQAGAPTYPAYEPAIDGWKNTLAASTFFAEDPFPAMQGQVSMINPVNDHATRYEPTEAFNDILVQGVRAGTPISEFLPDLEKRLIDLAQAEGYTIE